MGNTIDTDNYCYEISQGTRHPNDKEVRKFIKDKLRMMLVFGNINTQQYRTISGQRMKGLSSEVTNFHFLNWMHKNAENILVDADKYKNTSIMVSTIKVTFKQPIKIEIYDINIGK